MRPRRHASLVHLIALVLLAMLAGGTAGYFYTGMILDPVQSSTITSNVKYHQTLRTQRFLKSLGIKDAKKGFVAGAVLGGVSMASFLLKARLSIRGRIHDEKI
ncbi:MAG: hypothetical protein N2Z21_01785 [Candidatus Sumerlaeaceae bacterium]|nr:hypothetical protein [Candidatus Sumerlaeaceae bacterium]